MKHVLLSADGPIALYEVPDEIAENLRKYCLEFLDWIYYAPENEAFRTDGYFPEAEFINYVNTVVYPDITDKSRFIKEIDAISIIPEEYKSLPWFNF